MDINLRKRKHQWALLQEHKVGVIFFHTQGLTFWDQVKKVIIAWVTIRKQASKTKAPFAYKVKKGGKLEVLPTD